MPAAFVGSSPRGLLTLTDDVLRRQKGQQSSRDPNASHWAVVSSRSASSINNSNEGFRSPLSTRQRCAFEIEVPLVAAR